MDRDIEKIIAGVNARIPEAVVSQLQVKHPGIDDDGLWDFDLPGCERRISLESSLGICPFIVENTETRAFKAGQANTVSEAVDVVCSYLLKVRAE